MFLQLLLASSHNFGEGTLTCFCVDFGVAEPSLPASSSAAWHARQLLGLLQRLLRHVDQRLPAVFAFLRDLLGQFLQLGDRLVVGVLALLDDAAILDAGAVGEIGDSSDTSITPGQSKRA